MGWWWTAIARDQIRNAACNTLTFFCFFVFVPDTITTNTKERPHPSWQAGWQAKDRETSLSEATYKHSKEQQTDIPMTTTSTSFKLPPNLKYISCQLQDGDQGILRIQLNRPAAFNAINAEMLHELHTVLDVCQHPNSILISADNHPRVIIITATPPSRAFSAGVDIKAADRGIGGQTWDYTDIRSQQLLARMIEKLRQVPQPIIVGMQGPAAGAGMAIALAADVRIATKSASFSAAFVRLGLTGCDMGTSFFLPRLVGSGIAAEALLTGRALSAERAYQVGMVNEIVDTVEGMHGAVTRMAVDMCKCSRSGLQLTKEQLNAVQDGMSLRATIVAENSHQMLLVNDSASRQIAQKWLNSMLTSGGSTTSGGGTSGKSRL